MEKRKITRTTSKSKLEGMLEKLMAEVEALKANGGTAGVRTTKQNSYGRPKKLEKQRAAGTGSIFWGVHKPITVRQADADTGRYYKSADGKRIRVFFINKDFPQAPIIGAIEIQPGVWDARVWNYDGGMRVPYGHGSNIVGFWGE